jgi:hypothetical protein
VSVACIATKSDASCPLGVNMSRHGSAMARPVYLQQRT